MKKPREVGQHLVVDPRVCFGKLTFKGTRVPVETVLYFLSEGDTFDELIESWPEVKKEALAEAIRLASSALVKQALTNAHRSRHKSRAMAKNDRKKPIPARAEARR